MTGYRSITPTSGSASTEELDFFRSDFFKIILKDPHGPQPVVREAPTVESAFFVHKELLASLSPELEKHVKNDMREGREGEMQLGEVEEGTIKAFLYWVYKDDYYSPVPKGTTAILFHTKIYVLADRFNITKLKDLAFSRITTLFVDCGMVADKSDVDAIVEAVAYACDKLPLSLDNLNVEEKLLVYMAQYAAWARDSLRMNAMFVNLLLDCPEFAIALLFSSTAASIPPWVADTGESSKCTLSHDSTSHILSRHCGNCDYRGVMAVWCKQCHRSDYEVELQIVVGGRIIGEAGAHQLSGKNTDFHYTCKWCNHEQHCSSDGLANSYHLVCRRCGKRGSEIIMSLV